MFKFTKPTLNREPKTHIPALSAHDQLHSLYQEYTQMNIPSQFDSSLFMDATTTEALTKRPPLPIGSEWLGIITDLKAEAWESKKPEAKVKSGHKFAVTIDLDSATQPMIKEITGFDKLTLEDGIMLETNATGIDWSPGKNGKLRTYREALGLNEAGQPFSPRMMIGRPIRVKISHREYPPGSGEFFDQIAAVSKP